MSDLPQGPQVPLSAEAQHRERESFFGGMKVMAVLTLLSRVMGMFRAMAIASLGATRLTDAFSLAFRIPNLFRRLFGEGALSAAFVPVFSETAEKHGPQRTSRLFTNALGLLALFLSCLLIAILAGLLVWEAFWPGGEDRRLLVILLALMLPFMVTVCLLALGSAALNCRGHFAYPAAAPILLNVIIIAAAVFVAPLIRSDVRGQLYVVAASVTVGGTVELAGVLWLLHRMGFDLRPRLRPVENGIRQMLRTMAPMLVGLGLLQITELLESAMAWVLTATDESPTIHVFGWVFDRPLREGVLARVDAARYLYQFPMGVLATSLAVAVFPLLSRYAARGDMVNLRASVNRALRLGMMEGLAAGVGLFLLAEPVTRMLYQHRNFTADDTRQAAFILRMYVLGMWAFCTYQILVRAYYSVKDTVTPLKVSCSLMGLELVMVASLVWVPWLGAGAFGLTTATVFSVNAGVLAIKLRKRLGRFGGRKLLKSVARSVVACAVMAGVILALQHVLAGQRSWVIVGACVPAGAAAFLAAARALRSPELGELFGAMKRRRQRGDDQAPAKPQSERDIIS
jgi:putative peptidoglycan lipid II flippase